MNGTVTPTGFPGFAPGEHRHLIADVHRWARTNGWNWHECWGWVNARYASNVTLGIDWDSDNSTVTVRAGQVLLRPTTYPVGSVRQAVDLLVALDILPVQFSSAYEAGLHDAICVYDNREDGPR